MRVVQRVMPNHLAIYLSVYLSVSEAAAARETEELANLPSGKVARNQHRKREPVKRTEEEIVALRAVRAAKRALTGAPPHDPNAGRR